MKVIKKYDQHRRDLTVELKCEGCGREIKIAGYDDDYFWRQVVPNMKCSVCEQSTVDMGLEHTNITTRYKDYEVV